MRCTRKNFRRAYALVRGCFHRFTGPLSALKALPLALTPLHFPPFFFRASCVAFNPFHDQIIVSGGTDSRVNLWRIPSVSSAPLLELDEGDSGEGDGEGSSSSKVVEPRLAADQAVRVHTDHSDSVTGLAWSLKNAWVYASLSYSGRVAISTVPSAEKYRVLL